MKEAEIDALVMPWVNARVAHLLLVCRMTTVEVGDSIAEESSPDDYDQVMFTQNVETIEPLLLPCMVPDEVGKGLYWKTY